MEAAFFEATTHLDLACTALAAPSKGVLQVHVLDAKSPVAFDVVLAEGTMSCPVVTFTPVCFCMVFSFANSKVLFVSGDGGSF